MAPVLLFSPQRIRFPIYRNFIEVSWSNFSDKNVTCLNRLSNLPHSHINHLPRSSFSICFDLPNPIRSPFQSSFVSMATVHAAPDGPQSSSASAKTVRVVISGRVQGVFYRNWTIENATQLNLKGWVRNRRDGSVEALFSGNPDSVKEMEMRCRRGPPEAMVTKLQVFPSNDDPGTGFECKQTV